MDAVDGIERRICELESRLFGNETLAVESQQHAKLAEELLSIHTKLQQLSGNRSSVKEVFHNTGELMKCLDPALADRNTVPDHVKLRLIDSDSGMIETAVGNLARIEKLQRALDSEHIRHAPTQMPNIEAVAAKQAKLSEAVSDQTREISELVRMYNDIIVTLNRQFVYWDQELTKLEQANAQKS